MLSLWLQQIFDALVAIWPLNVPAAKFCGHRPNFDWPCWEGRLAFQACGKKHATWLPGKPPQKALLDLVYVHWLAQVAVSFLNWPLESELLFSGCPSRSFIHWLGWSHSFMTLLIPPLPSLYSSVGVRPLGFKLCGIWMWNFRQLCSKQGISFLGEFIMKQSWFFSFSVAKMCRSLLIMFSTFWLSLIGIREPVFSFPHRKTQQATTRYISPSTSNSQKSKNWSERNLTLKSSVLPGNPPVSCLKIFQNLELEVATKSKNCPTLPKAFTKHTIKRIVYALLLLFIPVF